MRLLLDTHAFLWWLDGDRRMSRKARALVADPGHNADRGPVSVVSLRLHVELLGGSSGLDPAGPAPTSGRSEAVR